MRWTKILILIAVLTTMLTGLGFSQSISVTLPGDAVGDPGSSVTIGIQVGDLTGRGVIAFQTVVAFDENVLHATGASSSGTLSGAFGPPTVNTATSGKISVGGFGTSPLSGSGTLINLTFDVVGQAGSATDLVFESFVFNSGDPPAATQNGRFTVSIATGIHHAADSPDAFLLRQNYPNPFNPQTSIPFIVPANRNAPVTLQVFSIQGRLVRTLLHGIVPSGEHTVVWDGKDSAGQPVPSGTYLYRIYSGGLSQVRRMVLTR